MRMNKHEVSLRLQVSEDENQTIKKKKKPYPVALKQGIFKIAQNSAWCIEQQSNPEFSRH